MNPHFNQKKTNGEKRRKPREYEPLTRFSFILNSSEIKYEIKLQKENSLNEFQKEQIIRTAIMVVQNSAGKYLAQEEKDFIEFHKSTKLMQKVLNSNLRSVNIKIIDKYDSKESKLTFYINIV